MNATEKKYLRDRIADIRMKKQRELQDHMYATAITLTSEERLNLVIAGKVKLKSKRKLNELKNHQKDYIKDVYDFSYHENPYDSDLYNEKAKILREEEIRVVDQVMLGESDEALKLMKEFEKFKV